MMSAHGSSLASLTNVLEPLTLMKSDDATVIVKKWLSTCKNSSLSIDFFCSLVHENNIKHEGDPNNNNTHSMDTSIYYCSSCPYTNANRLLFEQHVIHHNLLKFDDEMYRCSFCTFIANEKDAFDDHQMLHIMKEDFQQDETANAVENAVI
jgi:hypothetical protein